MDPDWWTVNEEAPPAEEEACSSAWAALGIEAGDAIPTQPSLLCVLSGFKGQGLLPHSGPSPTNGISSGDGFEEKQKDQGGSRVNIVE